MVEATFFQHLATGPKAKAVWSKASDGVKLRLVAWPHPDPDRKNGTIFIFQGRSEYSEKYGPVAERLHKLGFNVITCDWRGQGLSERFLKNRSLGHVNAFSDYQHDVAAMQNYARELKLPRPYYMIAHSMGGAIGLRTLINGSDFERAVFSAPMWGIKLKPWVRYSFRLITWTLEILYGPYKSVPVRPKDNVILNTNFADNNLTNDPAVFSWMQSHLAEEPQLGLGGPTLQWANEARSEILSFRHEPLPEIPAKVLVAESDSIVDNKDIKHIASRWPNATLQVVPGAKHELFMEEATFQTQCWQGLEAHFSSTE